MVSTAGVGCTPRGWRAHASFGRVTPCRTSGTCWRRSGFRRPIRGGFPSRCRSTRPPRPPSRHGSSRRAHNPPRPRPAPARPMRRCRGRATASRDEETRVIVTSGPSDAAAAARVVAEARATLPTPKRDHVLEVGDFSLPELRALLDRAALYVGGDSGPLHLAATTTVPIVAVYGPTLPVRSEPWRDPSLVTESVETAGLACRPCDQRTCVPGDFRCLTRIAPDQVMAAAERALARSSNTVTAPG